MAMTGDVDWVFWTLGGLLGLAGLALASWALFADRAKGRKRCPKCWYDMTGSPGPTCSECGYTAKREKKLRKTRRRWRWAIVAALLVVGGYISSVRPRSEAEGNTFWIPTTFLIAIQPWLGERDGNFQLVLAVRASNMWRWQQSWALHRYADLLRAADDDSIRSYAGNCVWIIAHLGSGADAVLPELLQAIEDPDPGVRFLVASALGEVRADSSSCVTALVDMLNDQDAFVRYAAAKALGKPSQQQDLTIRALKSALADPSFDVRIRAVESLLELSEDPETVVPVLVEAISHPDLNISDYAMVVLRGLQPQTGLPALVDALGNKDLQVRQLAIGHLADWGPHTAPAVPALLDFVKDENDPLRVEMVRVLGGIGPGASDAIPLLTDLLNHPNPDLRNAAENALTAIQLEK